MTTDKHGPVRIRPIEKDDVDLVLQAEAAFNMHRDPDFEVETPAPWAKDRDSLMSIIRQRQDKEKDTHDTRTYVAEIVVGTVEGRGIDAWVCGAVSYELAPGEYHILLLNQHPKAADDVLHRLVNKLVTKCKTSLSRSRVSMHIPDGQYNLVKFFQDLKWPVKLVPSYFDDGSDAWYTSYDAEPLPEDEDLLPV